MGDIQEVVPVKSEPRDPPNPNQSLAYPEDSYEDYGQYGDEQEYQSGMAGMSGMGNQPGVTGAVGAEGYSFQDPSELLHFVKRDPIDQKFHCTICGNFSHKNSYCTRNHVESQHFPETFSYPCDQCDMVFTTKSNFSLHRSRKH